MNWNTHAHNKLQVHYEKGFIQLDFPVKSNFIFPMSQKPLMGQCLLIIETSRYVVLLCVLLDTSSRYEVTAGRVE